MPVSIAIRSARNPTVAGAPVRERTQWGTLALALAAAAVVLALLPVCLPVNHDEAQYVAPALLAGHLRPYADFIYLQTPLQLYLTAPLAALAHGWSFLALRLANARTPRAMPALASLSARKLQPWARAASGAVR